VENAIRLPSDWYKLCEGNTRCAYEVPGMIILPDLKGAMRLDVSKDMSVHV